MRFAQRFVVSAAALVAALAPAASARAFCRTTTCKPPAAFVPTATLCENPSWVEQCAKDKVPDVVLWWKTACVGYSVQRDASPKLHLTLDQVNSAADHAFKTWTSQTCPDAGGGRVSIDAVNLGPVECGETGDAGYHSDRPNQHVIVFRDDVWPHEQPGQHDSETIALTTVAYDINTGEIFDADTEVNSADYKLVYGVEPPMGVYDIEAVLTHEAGHFLGLSHSPIASAIMFYSNGGGSSLSHPLAGDDIAGICAIYPPDGTRSVDKSVDDTGSVKAGSCDPVPRHGFSSECAPPPSNDGCGVGAPGADVAGGAAWLGAFVGAGAIVRRKRRRRA